MRDKLVKSYDLYVTECTSHGIVPNGITWYANAMLFAAMQAYGRNKDWLKGKDNKDGSKS